MKVTTETVYTFTASQREGHFIWEALVSFDEQNRGDFEREEKILSDELQTAFNTVR